jgi:hypothetical protein
MLNKALTWKKGTLVMSTVATAAPRTAPAIRFGRPFLSQVTIDYGPAELLGRLFLRWDADLHKRGISLSFAPVESLMQVNRLNSDSWRPLVPIFDAEIGGFNEENGFCLLGRNKDGEVIAAQAARLYTLTKTTFQEESESLRLFYADPEKSAAPGEQCIVTAKSASRFTGRIVYSGAVWYRPDYRRQGLTSILPRLTKAYAFTKWYTDVTLSFMIDDVVSQGTAARAGYPHVEWEVLLKNTPLGDHRGALIWASAQDLIDYFSSYLGETDSQVDSIVYDRAA